MTEESDPILRLKQLERACRIGFLVVTAFFTYFAVRLSFNIDVCAAIYKDMLNGKELPLMTRMIISGKPLILLAVVIIPVLAVLCAVGFRRSDHAIIGISLCSVVILVTTLMLWSGLTDPLVMIISQLTAGV